MRGLLLTVFLLAAFAVSHLVAAESVKPVIVTAPEVKYMMAEDEAVVLIHALSAIEYNIQHIPGSINIPTSRINVPGSFGHQLPEDKNTPLIFYCMGIKCSYSRRASEKALKLGYQKVFWFRGGIPEWHRFLYPMTVNKEMAQVKIHRLSPKKVASLRRTEDPLILDVRPLFWQGSKSALKASIFIPLVELNEKYTQLDKSRPIIVADAYMKQSPNAARFLISKGYNVLGIVKGGFVRWEKEGYPVINTGE